VVDSIWLRLVSGEQDLSFLSALARDPLVEPFLAPGTGEPEALRALVERSGQAQLPEGLYVIHSPEGRPLGGLALVSFSRRSRICGLERVMLRPDARGTGVATAAIHLAARTALIDHGLHRVQAEVYEDNIAGQRLFERAGFTREGRRRRAYWRRQRWLDGILYGLLAEEFEQRPAPSTGSPP
jgi:RimJ/RimL family protein N-acetyltransferase